MIAFLEYQRVHTEGQALLILPASLIGNWQKEIEKFAPEMPYQILHKSDLKNSEAIKIRESGFLYITTYGAGYKKSGNKADKGYKSNSSEDANCIDRNTD